MAETVKDVVSLKNEYADAIMDRRIVMDEELVGAILSQSLMTWEGRNPAPALDQDGNFQGTDLDLMSFLVPIANRGAVIEIPRYRNRRKVVVREGERKIGTNQFGPITGLTSHQDVHSFSVRIYDNTIVVKDPETEKEQTGAHRNYMLVDCDGFWYPGWDRIYWNPTAPENRFLAEKSLWTKNTVYFTHYVHPARWQSVFGAPHLLAKMLIARLDDQAHFFRHEMKRLEAAGISLPHGEKAPYRPAEYEGATKPIKVDALEMTLDIPEFSGDYVPETDTQMGLLHAYQRQKYLTYTLKPLVQFTVRANEAAYFGYGCRHHPAPGKVAHWMERRTWRPGWKAPRGRTEWYQMTLGPSTGYRYRIKTITQQVSDE